MRFLLVASAALVLAGCAGPAEEPKPASDENTVTDPSDYNYTVDEPHRHDYWGGRDRLTIIDMTADAGVFVFSSSHDFVYRPDAGIVIPQGTATVEVTLDWADDPSGSYGGTEFWVQTAATSELARVDAIAPGETVTVESTNEDNDLPHQRLSGWRFALHLLPDDAGRIAYHGDVTVRVEAVRGLDIPLYPGHPDQWENETTIPLLDIDTGVGAMYGSHDNQLCAFTCLDAFRPDDGRIVPIDADRVEATLSWTAPATTPGLAYHHAQSWELIPLDPESETLTSRTYVIPVDGHGDGAYAKQSLWEFVILIEEPLADGVHVGDYELVASASKGTDADAV